MIKVGLYIEIRHKNLDCSHIELGNPGLGGTQYQMLLLAYHLANTYKDRFDVCLFVDEKVKFANDGIIQVQLTDKHSLRDEIVKSKISVLIIRSELEILRCLDKIPVKIITWSHNFFRYNLAKQIAKQENISANVFVGKQQYDRYIDDDVIDKSVTIFNMVPSSDTIPKRSITKSVLYVGALIPAKGFHILASMWKQILKREPDAQLYVLGSGKLYGKAEKMGSYGLAEKNYEDEFMRYLTDDKGNILPSVHFEGVVGNNKDEYFRCAAVGIINPSAKTETFGLGVIEMNTYSIPTVAINKNSFPDVVIDGETGYLCHTKKEIANKLVYLLGDIECNVRLGKNAYEFSRKFSPKNILPQWVSLIESVSNDNLIINYTKPIPPYRNNFKWLIVIVRFMRYNMRMKWLPSTIRIISYLMRILGR